MKTILTLLSILALGIPAYSQAAKEKKPMKKAAAEKPAEKAPEAAPAGDDKSTRPLPMNARVDEIDAAGKTFTLKRKDGVAVKHVVTDATEIKQGDAAAKFEDIKVGDVVAGLRNKKSDTEYEVVKITKFGAPKKKAAADGDTAEKTADEKKK